MNIVCLPLTAPDDSERAIEMEELISGEDNGVGSVSPHIYWSYICSGSLGLFCLVIALHLVQTIVCVATDGWLAVWTAALRKHQSPNQVHSQHSPSTLPALS